MPSEAQVERDQLPTLSKTKQWGGALTSGRLVRSVLTLGIAQPLSWVGAVILTVVLPRYLGDVGLGKLVFALGLTGLVGLMADLGSATFLTKAVARDPARAGLLTVNALAMRVPLSLAAAGLAVVLVNLLSEDGLTRQIVYVLCPAIVLDAMSKVMLGSLQGLQQMKIMAVLSVVGKLGYGAIAAGLLVGGGGPVEAALAWIISLTLGLTLGLVALHRFARLSPRIDWEAWRLVLLGGLPFFVWQSALMVYAQIDIVLLSVLTHDAVVGWYGAAYRIIVIPGFLPGIIVTVVFPALAAAGEDNAAFARIARRAAHFLVVLSVPLAFGIGLLPDKLIGLFGYPDSFANSVVPLVLLAAHIPLASVDTMIGTVLITRDRQRQWAGAAVAAALLNPALNLAVIPYAQATYGNGAIGAAAITTLTEVFMLAVGVRLLPPGVFNAGTLMGALKCVLAGLIMGAAVWLARGFPLPVPVLLGALVYGGASLALRTVSIADLQQIRLHLSQRQRAN